MMTIHILPNNPGTTPGKLADVELHFADGPLAGLKLIGFGVWERHTLAGRRSANEKTGPLNVTFPARQYSVNGERRSFALLRPIEDTRASDRIRDLILAAYAAHVEGTAGRFGVLSDDDLTTRGRDLMALIGEARAMTGIDTVEPDQAIDTSRPHVSGCPRGVVSAAECLCNPTRTALRSGGLR